MARSAPRKRAKSKRRRPAATRRGGRRLPLWVWLIAGAAVTVFVVVIVHLAQPRHNLQSSLTPSTPVRHTPGDGPVRVPPAKPPRYSFYRLLPGRHLAPRHAGSPPVKPEPTSTPKPGPEASPSEPAAQSAPPAHAQAATMPSRPAPATPAELWLVQVGSYRSEAQANQARARADLLGVVAHLRAAMVDGQLWYRVRIGPVAGEDKATALRDKLKAGGMPAIAFKRGN